MIITAKFRKDRTSIHPYHVAHGLYIPTARPEGSCTAGGCCELSAREQSVVGLPTLFYRMRQNTQH